MEHEEDLGGPDESTIATTTSAIDLYIQYGDIVSFQSPSNVELHQHTFFVDYVSETKIRLLDVASLEPTTLYLTDTGHIPPERPSVVQTEYAEGSLRASPYGSSLHFRDESIEVVELLSRANERGYARQSGLLPRTWIKVEFGGDFPMLIVGEVTALDEDQIEITTYPTREVLYIDFAYQGLPEDLHIVSWEIVAAPPNVKGQDTEEGQVGEPLDLDDIDVGEAAGLSEEHTPELDVVAADPTVRDTLHQMYLDANEIVFGPDEDDVVVGQVVEISEHEKVYSIGAQTNDLLDEMLSTIPDAQRTPPVMDQLHRLLARFRELRHQFSRTDGDTGRVLGPRLRTTLASDKPLVPCLQPTQSPGPYLESYLGPYLGPYLDKRISNLSWLVPVVSCRRKLYDVADAVAEDVADAELATLSEDLNDMMQLQRNYAANRDLGNTNHDRYLHLQSRMAERLTPFVEEAGGGNTLPNTLRASAPIDTVIDNDLWEDSGKIISTVVYGTEGAIRSARCVPQRFQPGETVLRPVYVRGKKTFERTAVSPAESLHIRSWMALPAAWMEFSRVRLPTTNLLHRVSGGAQWPMRFRRLNGRSDVLLIESGTGSNPTGLAEHTLMQGGGTKLFVLENGVESSEYNPDDIGAMIPDTIHLMDSLETPTSTSLSALTARLEPFLVYSDDLTYLQYKHAQHIVHRNVREMKTRLQEGNRQADLWRNHRFTHTYDSTAATAQVSLSSLLRENPELLDHAEQVYELLHVGTGKGTGKGTSKGTGKGMGKGTSKSKDKVGFTSSSETWTSIMNTDGGTFLTLLIRALLLKLQIPVSFLESATSAAAGQKVDDMDALEQIKPQDCARRFLTKTYTSLGELQQDNHEDIFYDKEMDDTPYGLLKAYASEKKTMTRDAFEAYLAENLVQKHGCPRNQSLELAHTLIEGKKPVRDGEYAVLSISPKMKDKDTDVPISEYITKHTYYVRTRGVWVKDDTTSGLNESAFVDSNTLFCNIKSSCTHFVGATTPHIAFGKQTSVNVCADMSTIGAPSGSPSRIPAEIARKELAERYARTTDEMEKMLEDAINLHMQRMSHLSRLRDIQLARYNLYGWTLGKHAREATGIVSPAAAVRDQMLAETDFVLRQHHVVAFVDNYARTPMVETLGEDPHWLYCTDTNTKLLPAFLYELARAFTTNGTEGTAGLNAAMDRVIQHHGVMSDDGDAIVDKYSGYVIRKIDYVTEDEFDDVTGLRIPTHSTLAATDAQEDAAAAIATAVAGGNRVAVRAQRVFENATSETIYRMFTALCYQNMGIAKQAKQASGSNGIAKQASNAIDSSDALEDFVIRVASEWATAHIRSESSYEAASKKMEKDKGKKLMPYDTYRKQTLTFLVGAVSLVGIQTTVPPFRAHKTFPGCVQSFHGFPLAGIEDLSSILYVSCVLSAQDPSLKRKVLEEKIRGMLTDHILPLPEIQERYRTRHDYDQKYGFRQILPELHSLARWRTFLPPLIPIDADALGKTLHAVSKSQADQLLDSMNKGPSGSAFGKGSSDQHKMWAGMMGSMMRHGYGIAVAIHAVVADSSEAALLQTESRVPFLQNACCVQRGPSPMSCLEYFEAANSDLRRYHQIVQQLGTILANVREISTPPILFDPRDSRVYRTQVPIDHTYNITSTYAAFIHYGNFDHPDRPIPDDLEGVIPDKPSASAAYPTKGTIEEKIEALKKMGKRYDVDQLNRLLQIVFRRRQEQGQGTEAQDTTTTTTTHPINTVSTLVDFLDHLDTSTSIAVDAALRDRLLPVLAQYRPGTMVHEDSDATRALKNYVQLSNTRMRTEILDFMRRFHSNAGANEWDTWTATATAADKLTDPATLISTTQFLRNSVYQMCQVFSSRITHGAFSAYTTPAHWGLSSKHEADLTAMVEQYTHRLKPFVRDNTLSNVFDHLDLPFRDLIQLLQYIPIQSSVERETIATEGGNYVAISYYGLFDVKTTLLLHWHIWYSVYYLYLQAANDPELVRIDIETRRNHTRQSVLEEHEPMQLQAAAVDAGEEATDTTARETMWEADDSRQEVEIRMSTQEELRRRVAELTWTFFTLDRDVRSITDRSYPEIMATVHSFSKAEKKTKTDYLKNMSAEERRVEFQLKENRLGAWGVGTQKSIVAYNKDTYDREMLELQEQLQLLQPTTSAFGTSTSTTTATAMEDMDADELAQYEQAQADTEYHREEHNISHLGDDYTDGNYYGDDDDDNDFPEE